MLHLVKSLFHFLASIAILFPIYKNRNPMNLLRKLTELSPIRFLSHARIDISKKELVDFGIFSLICLMIIVYKINKAA